MNIFRTFLSRQYAGLFTAATLMAGADFCIGLVVSVVSGNCLGADAFAAMAAVYPYRLLPDIFALLLADGTASLYAQAIGRCDREDAMRIFSRGLFASFVIGVVLTVSFVLFEGAYLDFMGVTGVVRHEAESFGSGFVYTFLPTLVIMYVYPIVYIDGGAKRCLYGAIGYMVVQIVAAWCFCRWWGSAGLAWSVLASLAAFAGSILCHLRAPECSFRYRPTFDLKPLKHVFALGFGTSVQQIAALLQTFVLVRLASVKFGQAGLACLAVVASVESFICFTKAAAQSALPLVSVYFGEDNRSGVAATMRYALGCVVIEGLLFAVLLMAFPHGVAALFGLSEVEYADQLAKTCRVVGVFLMPASVTFLWGMYFRMVGNTRVLALYAPMQWIVFPLTFAVLGAYAFGPVGLACGFAGQLAWLLIAVFLGWRQSVRRRLEFPLLLTLSKDDVTRVSVRADANGASQASQRVREIAAARLGPNDRRVVGMGLAAEEVVMVIADENAGRRPVRVELSVDFTANRSRIIVRDDGRLFDLTNPDNRLHSLSAYVLSRIMTVLTERINLTTAGHNRSILDFATGSQSTAVLV